MRHSTETAKARKASAAIYREAARRIEWRDDFSCNAISRVVKEMGGSWYCQQRTDYTNVFLSMKNDLWDMPDQQDIRVLMLCFMAAMVEAGDA